MLSKEILMEMITARVHEEDCNAGVIFDNLEAPLWPNLKFILEAICDALPTQNVQILMFQFQAPGAPVEQPPVPEGASVAPEE